MNKRYHYFYRITNLLNGHFYYGIHSTYNVEDGYMGSGKRLNLAYKKYGVENFTKEILKFFKTRNDAAAYEMEIVNETLITNDNCYNLILGGEKFNTTGFTSVFDENDGCNKLIPVCEYRNNTKRYRHTGDSMLTAFSIQEQRYMRITVDEYNSNKEMYKTPTSDKVIVKDSNGNFFSVQKDDIRLANGELQPMWCGRKHKKESIEKQKATFKKIGHQRGSKNSRFGSCWITNGEENRSVSKNVVDTFLNDGWVLGRSCGATSKEYAKIDKEKLLLMRCDGKTWSEIANAFGVTVRVLQGYRKANKVDLHSGCNVD